MGRTRQAAFETGAVVSQYTKSTMLSIRGLDPPLSHQYSSSSPVVGRSRTHDFSFHRGKGPMEGNWDVIDLVYLSYFGLVWLMRLYVWVALEER